jgi:hypothetical protein
MVKNGGKQSYTAVYVLCFFLALFIIAIIVVLVIRNNKSKNPPKPTLVQCTDDTKCVADNKICRILANNTGFCLPKCTKADTDCPIGWTCGGDGKCIAPAATK